MKASTLLLHLLLIASLAAPARAGFRDPSASSAGERAVELEAAPRSSFVTFTRPTTAVAPKALDRMPAAAAHMPVGGYGPLPPPGYRPPTPAANNTATKAASSSHAPTSFPFKPAATTPVPRAPALPSADAIAIPGLQLPRGEMITIHRDPLPPIQVQGRNRAQVHNFSRTARSLAIPAREYTELARGQAVHARFAFALTPPIHQPIRTPLNLRLEAHHRIRLAPAGYHYDNMVKRVDALFRGLELEYPPAVQALWELSRAKNNPRRLQGRDALFAGILTQRAGWESLSANLLHDSLDRRVDAEARYAQILWDTLDTYASVGQVDRVIANVKPAYVKLHNPVGDQANYSMLRRVLSQKEAGVLRAEDLETRLVSPAYQQRVQLLHALAGLQAKEKSEQRSRALASLNQLEANGVPEVQGDARLALARALLREGESGRSLDLYRAVKKDGRNRLEVLAEQAYAELKTGNQQEGLGKAVALQSPYFRFGFAPDVHLVEVVARKSMCDFGGAEAGLQRFQSIYAPELAALQQLSTRENVDSFYEELVSYHGLAEPRRYQRYLLHVPAVMENQKMMNGALGDLEKADLVGRVRKSQERPAGWENFLGDMKSNWQKYARTLRRESAAVALAEAAYLAQRLRATFGQAELLGLDLATAATRNFNLQSAMNFPVRRPAAVEDNNQFYWPFEQEIWEDELDFLKMKNPSKCAAAQAAPVASH